MVDRKTKKRSNVYDAVAGRVASTGFIPAKPRTSKNRDTLSSSGVAVPPEEVLFRRKEAPQRYEEDDFYWANANLQPTQRLPDSDLLKAIHTYTADFYARAMEDGGQHDIKSMDETALLAFGILLEESAAHVLGENGDMVFVEGEAIREQGVNSASLVVHEENREHENDSNASYDEGGNRGRKRRRID